MQIKNLIKKFSPVKGWFVRIKPPQYFQVLDQKILKQGKKNTLNNEDYKLIFSYLIEGINAYRSHSYAHVLYPGLPGTRGIVVEGLEGFARAAPMLATWLHSGREKNIVLHNKKEFNILEHLTLGIENGTNPKHSEYWGEITDFDQRSVEAGDIALTVWLLSEFQADVFNKETIKNIANWLEKINFVKLYGGNWCLFKLIVNTVLEYLGQDTQNNINQCYQEFKSFSVGDGWFGDGKNGFVDYYNVWQMQYYLYWLHEMKPDYDSEYLKNTFNSFSDGYQYMLSTNGMPMFGRSACYRLAAATPLIINSSVNKTNQSVSRRALEVSWSHFISKSALKHGSISQGYYSERPELIENYSGRGSALWSVRSLTVAFFQKECDDFWRCKPGKLPIEKSDYEVSLKGPGFTIKGSTATKVVTIFRNKTYFNNKQSNNKIQNLSTIRKIVQLLLRRPLREEHLNIKYGRKKYASNDFFCQ